MDVESCIVSRRTVHRYENSEIELSTIERACELALLAPNHKHTFPWYFISLGPHTRTKLIPDAIKLKLAKTENPDAQQRLAIEKQTTDTWMNPAAIIACCQKLHHDTKLNRENYASVACGIQNMTLYLKSKSWDSKWSTGKITELQTTYDALGVNSGEHFIAGFLFVGKPASPLGKQTRPKVQDTLKLLD